jgi:hypothetical protein
MNILFRRRAGQGVDGKMGLYLRKTEEMVSILSDFVTLVGPSRHLIGYIAPSFLFNQEVPEYQHLHVRHVDLASKLIRLLSC